ncbi:MAG: AraC family transcriptional regulator [Lentisphaeria bacterium]|nr:MAG: AraC family transcriptional regulator [Lentisphaeria bacterium]
MGALSDGRGAKEVLSWNEVLPGIFHASPGPTEFRRALRSLLEMHRLYLARRRNWYPLARNLLDGVLIRGGAGEDGESTVPMLLWQAQERLRNLSEPVDIDRLAEESGMSRAVFYLRFKEAVGVSPRRYRENYAMHCAWQLLENTDLSISDIARKVGMQNIYYFSTRFRKCCGVSPSSWRARNKRPQE